VLIGAGSPEEIPAHSIPGQLHCPLERRGAACPLKKNIHMLRSRCEKEQCGLFTSQLLLAALMILIVQLCFAILSLSMRVSCDPILLSSHHSSLSTCARSKNFAVSPFKPAQREYPICQLQAAAVPASMAPVFCHKSQHHDAYESPHKIPSYNAQFARL